MRKLKNFDWQTSIEKGHLIYHKGCLDKIDHFVIYIQFSILAISPLLIFLDPYKDKQGDNFWWSFWILPSILSLYIIYRKATENKLKIIGTQLDKKQIKATLLDYAHHRGYNIYKNSSELLIFNEDISTFNQGHKKTRIFLLTDKKVFFAIIQDRVRLNFPVVLSYFTTLWDVKHALRKSEGSMERYH